MKILKQLFTSISIAIFAVCCGAFIFFGYPGTGWKALAIPSGSMRPTMPPGTLVLVHSVPASDLNIGDVITYINPLNPKSTLSHRIIKKYVIGGKVPGYVTKGDANKSPDIPITIGSVEGKVIWHFPYAGYMLLDARKPKVILPITYIATLLIMLEEVGRLNEYYKRSQAYRLIGYSEKVAPSKPFSKKFTTSVALTFTLVLVSFAMGPTALALLKSNTVVLANNRLSVAATKKQCSGTTINNTSVTIGTSNNQTATSGNSSSTKGGTATSGSASNNSSSNINISVNDQC
jgi:signal peptidase I